MLGSGRSFVALSADCRQGVTIGHDGNWELWDVPNGRLVRSIKKTVADEISVAVSSNGHTLAAADRNGKVTLWDTGTGVELLSREDFLPFGVTRLAFSPDVRYLASVSLDHAVELREIAQDAKYASSAGIVPQSAIWCSAPMAGG